MLACGGMVCSADQQGAVARVRGVAAFSLPAPERMAVAKCSGASTAPRGQVPLLCGALGGLNQEAERLYLPAADERPALKFRSFFVVLPVGRGRHDAK